MKGIDSKTSLAILVGFIACGLFIFMMYSINATYTDKQVKPLRDTVDRLDIFTRQTASKVEDWLRDRGIALSYMEMLERNDSLKHYTHKELQDSISMLCMIDRRYRDELRGAAYWIGKIEYESRGNPNFINKYSGAMGLTCWMSYTARKILREMNLPYDKKFIFDPGTHLSGSLIWAEKEWSFWQTQGIEDYSSLRWHLLASWDWGSVNVEKRYYRHGKKIKGEIPKETRDYIVNVLDKVAYWEKRIQHWSSYEEKRLEDLDENYDKR